MSDFKKYNESSVIGQYYDWVNGGKPSGYNYSQLNTCNYVMFLSKSHPFKNGHWAGGGPFISVKVITSKSGDNATVIRPNWGKAYSGMFTVSPPSQTGPNLGSAYINQRYNALFNQGATAWHRLSPVEPDFTIATSLYELKDPLNYLKDMTNHIRKKVQKVNRARRKSGKSELSKTGQHFLAVQFGWLPILADIRNFVKAQKGAQKRLSQLIRDSGRPVRRSVTLSDNSSHYGGGTSTYDSGSGAGVAPGFVTQCYGPGPTFRRVHTRDAQRTWAEGVFRYHLPPGPRDVVWTKKMLRRIMGQRVTPDAVWNAMPWTWLADYYTNLGDFIANTTPGVADRLAADYAYLMQTSYYVSTRDANACVQSSMAANQKFSRPTASSSTYVVEKYRHTASPFGFGFKSSDLSPKQAAILGGLGLSKLP